MSSLWDVAAPLIVACLLGALGWGLRYARQARQRERDRDAKLDRLVLVFLEGTPADPFTGTPAGPSVVTRLGELDSLQRSLRHVEDAVNQLRASSVDHGRALAELQAKVDGLTDGQRQSPGGPGPWLGTV